MDAAAALAVGDGDGAAVQLGDPARDGQAETGAAVLGGARGEPFEDGASVGERDPGALVGDGYQDVVADRLGADLDQATGRTVAVRVVEEVGKQLVQPVGVRGHREALRRHHDRVAQTLDPGLGDRVLEQICESDVLEPQRGHALLDARQVEQVAHEAPEPLGLGQSAPQLFRAGLGHPVDEVLQHRLECGDRGAQLVGDVGDEVTSVPVDELEGGGHPVEGARQLAHLVTRGRAHPLGVVAL